MPSHHRPHLLLSESTGLVLLAEASTRTETTAITNPAGNLLQVSMTETHGSVSAATSTMRWTPTAAALHANVQRHGCRDHEQHPGQTADTVHSLRHTVADAVNTMHALQARSSALAKCLLRGPS